MFESLSSTLIKKLPCFLNNFQIFSSSIQKLRELIRKITKSYWNFNPIKNIIIYITTLYFVFVVKFKMLKIKSQLY